MHSDVAAPYVYSYARPEVKELWLPRCTSGEAIMAIGFTEPETGSDLAAIRTKAVRDGDFYVINGQKTFITNGYYADLFVVAVKTDPEAGHRGISLILVDKDCPGFSRGRKLEKMGYHMQDTAELYFEDCRVPVSHLLGAEGEGFKYMMEKGLIHRIKHNDWESQAKMLEAHKSARGYLLINAGKYVKSGGGKKVDESRMKRFADDCMDSTAGLINLCDNPDVVVPSLTFW